MNNVTVIPSYYTISKNITLDLNRNTVSGGYLYVSNSQVTIDDTSSEKNGKITSSKTQVIYVRGNNTVLTINGGTVNSNKYDIYIESGTVNITGGTVNSNKYGIASKNNATVNLSGGTVSGVTAVDMQGGIINVSDNAIVDATSYGISLQNATISDASTAAKLNMTGGTVKSGAQAICGNNQYSQGTTATISGGTITGGTGIYWPIGGTLTVSDNAYIEGSLSGIEVKQGTINIEGGIIKCTGAYNEYTPSGNGTVGSGWALAVSTQQYATTIEGVNSDVIVNIIGGTT